MSTSTELNEATLAREMEKAAVAKAKAEMEAEREAMRAELAAIEEEERLEAERALQEATQSKNSKSQASSSSTPLASPTTADKAASTTSKTPKVTRTKSDEADTKPKSETTTSQPSNSSESTSKADRKEKKDKKKDKATQIAGADSDATSKDRKKTEKDKTGVNAVEASGAVDSPSTMAKSDRKDKKDKKTKGSGEAGEANSSVVSSLPSDSPSLEGKDRKEKDKPSKNTPRGVTVTSDAMKKSGSKDKLKSKDGASTSASKSTSDSGDKKDKREKGEASETGDKSTKEKDKKKKDVPGRGSDGSAAAPSAIKVKSPGKTRTVGDGAVAGSSEAIEAGTAKSAPKPLTRVESSLKIPVLDLSNRRIAELPLDISNCTYLTKLYLSRNMLVDVNALSALTELTVLNISNNSLVTFPAALSAANSKLKDLILADNKITTVPATISKLQFPVLTKLDLMGNKFADIPAPIFTVLSLTSLNMSWNLITEVPKAVSALINLTSLALHHNQIKRVANGICQLGKLASLELQDNQLTSLPEAIADLSSLTSIDVSRNLLKEWPTAFTTETEFASLIKLDLSHNLIAGPLPDDRFPVEPTLFPSIEEVYLNHNTITQLPEGFWRNISTVSILDIRHNQITELSPEIESFYSLSCLEVGGNRLTSLPTQIGLLSNLQVLSFYDNLITEIPSISALEYLQYLNAGHNQISEVCLDGLSSLEEAFLSGNPIKQLPETIGDTCPNLKLLFASDLLLKKVPAGLSGATLLEQIDFSNNRITEIPPVLGDLESLKSISFAHCKLETSKEREVLKTPGKGPWDCIEFWQNFNSLLMVDLSYNKLKLMPKGLETKVGTECEIILIGNPMATEEIPKATLVTPQLGKRFQVGWAEMLGRRPTMEDHFLWQGSLDGNTNVDLFAVFDGHAAREAAKFCSEYMPNVMKEELAKLQVISPREKIPKLLKTDTLFTNVFATVNAALEKHLSTIRDTSVKHCGSTAVVVLVVGDTMQIANVGDSRAVLSTGERCTVDHKPRAETDRIRAHPGGFVTGDGTGRINEVLAVSRSLGDFYMHPWVTCEPHVFTKTLTKEDKYLILACDGIWDEVEDADAIKIVDPLVQEGDLFKAASKLRDLAYCAGSDDNISVMIIKLSSK